MKDLLEISGLMNVSYFTGNFLFTWGIALFTVWVPMILFLVLFNILTMHRVAAYGALASLFSGCAIAM
jgi:hypothetical protein